MFTDLGFNLVDSDRGQVPMLFCDSQGAIIAAEQNPSSKNTRHIDVRRHSIKEKIESGTFYVN